MKLKTQFIIICREAFLEAGTNNLNLIRIFSTAHASAFPHVLPPFALVVNFDIDTAGPHTLRTEIIDPEGKQVARNEMPVTIGPPSPDGFGRVNNWQVIANFEQFRAPIPGTYTFRLMLDDMPLGERTLEVRPASVPKVHTKKAAIA
jgi:hypothetical protein